MKYKQHFFYRKRLYFREYGRNNTDNYWQMNMEKFENKGTLIFSARGTTDVELLLCSAKNYEKESCFVVIING